MNKKIIGTICCWKCKRSNVTLKKCISNDDKEKTSDYVCEKCEAWYGRKEPPIGNQSVVYKERKKI